MRNTIYPMAAALAALSACAPVAPPGPTLAGTSWRVVAINGQPTPAVGNYSMNFEAGGQVGARFGCNSMGGRYRQTGSTLIVSDMATTLMGCPEPQGTHERLGSAVLGQPMAVSFAGPGQMTLANSAGTLALNRLP